MKRMDLTGTKFGRLTVKAPAGSLKSKTRWYCVCECGNTGVYVTGNLRSGDTKSCGCLPQKKAIHGHNRKGARTKTYRIWAGMMSRCTSPACKDYKFYGARGIKVCDRWTDFKNFLADMGEATGDMTIDRIDPTKDYEHSNYQWLSHSENCRKAHLKARNVFQLRVA